MEKWGHETRTPQLTDSDFKVKLCIRNETLKRYISAIEIRVTTSFICFNFGLAFIWNTEFKEYYQMATSKTQTQQTNGKQLSYSWLGIGIS